MEDLACIFILFGSIDNDFENMIYTFQRNTDTSWHLNLTGDTELK